MNALVLAATGMGADLDRLERRILDASADEARDAFDRLGLAREWAKLQEEAAAYTERLVWIEALILQRIGVLGAEKDVLKAAHRAAARHFSTLDQGELAALLSDYPGRTAVQSYNLWARSMGLRKARKRGFDAALGCWGGRDAVDHKAIGYQRQEETVAEVRAAAKVGSLRAAASLIVEEYLDDAIVPLSVTEIADAALDECGLGVNLDGDPVASQAFRSGFREAIREAIASAPVATTDRSATIPRFILVHDAEADSYLRVPSEFATVRDAKAMLDLRQGYLTRQIECFNQLAAVLNDRFGIKDREDSDWLRDDETAWQAREVRDNRERTRREFGVPDGMWADQ